MQIATYSDIRKNFKDYLDKACNDFEPIFIKRKNGKNAVILCEEAYRSLDETEYLLSNPHNKKALLEALDEVEKGETVTFKSIKEFKDAFDIS